MKFRFFDLRLPVVFLLGILPGRLTSAHDIPNARVDRGIQVLLYPGQLRIEYEVALAELTLAQDLRSLQGRVPLSNRSELFDQYGEVTAPLNAKGLLVSVNGESISLDLAGFDLTVEEHPVYRFHFEADLPEQGHLEILDTNYNSGEGTSRLALKTFEGVEANSQDLPTDLEDVPERPLWMLSFEEERQTKQLALDYRSFRPLPLESAVVLAPDSEAPSPVALSDRGEPPAESSGANSDRLSRLLDRSSGSIRIGIWLLAVLLGAAHAIQPGHGKTIVAAAVVGRRGAWHQGVLLAVVTTLAHLLGVLAVALAIFWTRSTRYEEIDRTLVQIAGFWIAAIGLWRLGRHLGGHGEDEGQVGEDYVASSQAIGNRSLIGLGLAAGVIPCWDAILLIILAEAMGLLGFGLFLLTGFSLGMGAVLVAVGLASGRLRRLVETSNRTTTWGRWLGTISGLILATIGLTLLWG